MNASLQVLALLTAMLVCPFLSSQKAVPSARPCPTAAASRGFRDRSFGDPNLGVFSPNPSTLEETVKTQSALVSCDHKDDGGIVVVTLDAAPE